MAVSVVSFSFSRAAQPEAQRSTLLGDGFLYCILSATSLDPNLSGPQGPPPPAFSTTSCLLTRPISNCNSWLLSRLSYMTVRRPLNRLLDLWNSMFDCHQAEITVMQFSGHSLPVRQSLRVSWDFLPCPISSAKHAYAISFDYWPLECVTSFRRISLE